MKKILLASAGVMAISAGTGYAACIPTPDCASLGYESSSSCEGGIKCPFGNAWNCTVINKVNEITNKITELEKVIEESGGGGNKNCAVGHIYYSDKTCSGSYDPYDTSKTPIGVVVYIDGQGHGQVMALKSIGSYEWGEDDTDISTLQNFSSASTASQDLTSCANTEKILVAGDKSKYPAAWAAHEYKTEGTNAGDWCLPAAGIMSSIKNAMKLINIGYDLINTYGLVSSSKIGTSSYYWLSSERDKRSAWRSYFFNNNYGLDINEDYNPEAENTSYGNDKDRRNEVRPVLEF